MMPKRKEKKRKEGKKKNKKKGKGKREHNLSSVSFCVGSHSVITFSWCLYLRLLFYLFFFKLKIKV